MRSKDTFQDKFQGALEAPFFYFINLLSSNTDTDSAIPFSTYLIEHGLSSSNVGAALEINESPKLNRAYMAPSDSLSCENFRPSYNTLSPNRDNTSLQY